MKSVSEDQEAPHSMFVEVGTIYFWHIHWTAPTTIHGLMWDGKTLRKFVTSEVITWGKGSIVRTREGSYKLADPDVARAKLEKGLRE